VLTLPPSEARRQFFHLGELAERGPVLVLASTPFIVTSVGGPLPSPEASSATGRRHVDFALLGSLGLADDDFPPMSPRMEEADL
jgi:hypothetical protein